MPPAGRDLGAQNSPGRNVNQRLQLEVEEGICLQIDTPPHTKMHPVSIATPAPRVPQKQRG